MEIKKYIRIFLEKIKILRSPMNRVIGKIENRWMPVANLDAIELFGFDGSFHTKDYFEKIKSLEVWEIDPECYKPLRKNVPGAKIKIVDTFFQLSKCQDLFDLVIIDNPTSTFNQHCELFSAFPDVFGILKEDAVNVIPTVNQDIMKKIPYLFNESQLLMRENFYQTNTPDDVPLNHMVKVYNKLANSCEFEMIDHFSVKRTFVYYLVMRFNKKMELT